MIIESKVKTTVSCECVILRADGTVKDREVSVREYITETREVK